MLSFELDQVFPLEAYRTYRAHAVTKGYCDPFVPHVGEKYGEDGFPRFVFSGVAAGWGRHISEEGDDIDLRGAAAEWASKFIDQEGTNGSPFWKLFDAVLGVLDPTGHTSVVERRKHAVWTNLSKVGKVGETAPPDNDLKLRELDATQFRHELSLFSPDLLLCVSGSKLEETGNAVYSTWANADIKPSHEHTTIRRSPDGGWLYWTMHPQFRTNEWRDGVLEDVRLIVERLRAGR